MPNPQNSRGNPRPKNRPQRGARNPFIAAATAPDHEGTVSLSTLPKPVTLVLNDEEACALLRIITRAGDETFATLVKRKIDWTKNTNAKLKGKNSAPDLSRTDRRAQK
jgi:hypothetical protein